MKHFMLRLQKNTLGKQFFPVQNFMISWENLIKIGRAGGNALNQETPDQIRRVGISTMGFGTYSRNCHKMIR